MPETIHENQTSGISDRMQQLEKILNELLKLHDQLARCIERKKDAIRQAQIETITRICEQENVIAQEVAELEKTRLTLVGELTATLRPDASVPMTMLEIAAEADDAQGARLTARRDELRASVKQVRRASSVVRMASEKLNSHMIGVLQTVRSALSGAGVYERKGQVALGAQLEFSVDVRS